MHLPRLLSTSADCRYRLPELQVERMIFFRHVKAELFKITCPSGPRRNGKSRRGVRLQRGENDTSLFHSR